MKKIMSLSVLFMLLFPTVNFGQAGSAKESTLKMPSDEKVPETYLIIKGDTLWDISKRFYGDPFGWPGIWDKNKYINDPHWIYPGQVITFRPPAPPKPLTPLAKPEPLIIKSSPRVPEVKPEAPVEIQVASTPSLDNLNILRKLREPRAVFSEKSYMRTGFITKRSELPKDKVIGMEEESANANKYDIVFINGLDSNNFREGDLLAALAVGDRVEHPDTGEDLGVVVRYKGMLKVLSPGENRSRCSVTENFDPIEENDLVMPYRILKAPLFDAWVKPETVIEGTILAINEPMLSIHINDIIYIDRGSEDGV
ncbi:LysM peptidoglycan-binding domain-containing protein, partial [Candidatus Latescibacterota bacterium]